LVVEVVEQHIIHIREDLAVLVVAVLVVAISHQVQLWDRRE
jgi:hypothetical protein